MGWRLAVGALAAWAFAMIFLSSHHGQWSKVSFKISRKMIFVPTREKIKRAR
jgi:hypothetical protein